MNSDGKRTESNLLETRKRFIISLEIGGKIKKKNSIRFRLLWLSVIEFNYKTKLSKNFNFLWRFDSYFRFKIGQAKLGFSVLCDYFIKT